MRWWQISLIAIGFQTILTLNHIKFFPFSDHGVFELYMQIYGTKLYRVISEESRPKYIPEGIMYEKSEKIKALIENNSLNSKSLKKAFKKNIFQVHEYTIWKNLETKGIKVYKKVIFPNV